MMKNTQEQKTRQLALRFFSNAGVYGIGMILVRVGNFLVLPLYWSVLTPEDFGRITLAQILTQFLISILDLGLSGTIQRHYFEWKPEERPRHLASIWSCSLLFSFLVCLALSLGSGGIRDLYDPKMEIGLIYFGIWTAFFQNTGLLPFALCRIREQLKLFSIFSLGQFLTQTAGTLIFLFVFKMGYMGFLWGTLAGTIVYAFLSLGFSYREVQFPWKWWHLKAPLAYALPTLPAGILEGMGSVVDRFFLQKYIPLAELGIYSVGRQLGLTYNFFVSTLKSSWIPLVYRMVAERADAAKVLSRMSTYYLIVLLIPALAISALADDLIRWINKPDYFGVAQYIPFFVLAYVLYGVGNIYGRGLDLAKKTQYYWIVYAANFLVNIGLLALWAPKYGAWGAVAAFLIAGFVREGILIGLASYFYRRPVDVVSIVKTLSVNLIGYLLIRQIPEMVPWLGLLVKGSLVLFTAFLNFYFVFGLRGVRKLIQFIQNRSKKISIAKIGEDL